MWKFPAITRRTAIEMLFKTTGAGSILFGSASRLLAQSWPTRPIRVISPITAGSAADTIGRTVFEPMSSRLGQRMIVENRPGGEGTIGSAAVARAEPDGYTLLSHSAALTVVATAYMGLPYDTVRDFTPIMPMAKIPSVLVIGADKGIRSVDQLIAAARSRPFNYASPGAFTELNTERFIRSANFEAQRIPFKGAPEALTEVMAGRVDFYFSPVVIALSLIRENKVVAIAVTGSQRTPLLPDIPTFAEVGFAKADDNFWIGLFAPAKTSREIVGRLHDEAARAVKLPAVVEQLAKFGAEPITSTPEEFDATIRNQIAENAILIKAAGISAN